QRPAVVPEDGGLLRQSPRCCKGAALHVPHSAGRLSPGVEPRLGQERPKIKESSESGKFELEACPGPRPPRTGCTTTCVPPAQHRTRPLRLEQPGTTSPEHPWASHRHGRPPTA